MSDMAGNVWEWTSTPSGAGRVFHGGCWDVNGTICIIEIQGYDCPNATDYDLGFRVCR